MGGPFDAKWRSQKLSELVEPIAAVLDPLGYRMGETQDDPRGLSLVAIWETDALFVEAWFDYRDGFAVMVARPLPLYSPRMQPYWSKVYVSHVLQQRGIAPVSVEHRPEGGPDFIRRYAKAAALDLTQIIDILRGENLEVLDRIIANKPREDLRGIDYPA